MALVTEWPLLVSLYTRDNNYGNTIIFLISRASSCVHYSNKIAIGILIASVSHLCLTWDYKDVLNTVWIALLTLPACDPSVVSTGLKSSFVPSVLGLLHDKHHAGH